MRASHIGIDAMGWRAHMKPTLPELAQKPGPRFSCNGIKTPVTLAGCQQRVRELGT